MPEKVLQAVDAVIEDDGYFIDPRLSGTVIDATRIESARATPTNPPG